MRTLGSNKEKWSEYTARFFVNLPTECRFIS